MLPHTHTNRRPRPAPAPPPLEAPPPVPVFLKSNVATLDVAEGRRPLVWVSGVLVTIWNVAEGRQPLVWVSGVLVTVWDVAEGRRPLVWVSGVLVRVWDVVILIKAEGRVPLVHFPTDTAWTRLCLLMTLSMKHCIATFTP